MQKRMTCCLGQAIGALAVCLGLSTPVAACTLPPGGGITFTAAATGARPVGGAPLTLDWQVAALPAQCSGRVTLILDLPPEMRFQGDGFVALLPGDAGPFQTDHAADRLRLVVPLKGQGPWQGAITGTPYRLGPVSFGSALHHATTRGAGLEEVALEAVLQPGPAVVLDIAPGRPRLVAQEAAPTGQPDLVQLSPAGTHLLQVFGDSFRVTHAETGALVLVDSGLAPRFSPTGRFLHWFPRGYVVDDWEDSPAFDVGEDFVLFDLVAEETVLRLADLPRDYGLDVVLGVDWSPGDAFLLLHRGANSAMSLVQPLITDRAAFVAFGCVACDGLSTGVAVTMPALDAVALGTVYGFAPFPLLRAAQPEEGETLPVTGFDIPTEVADIRLAGGVRSSLAMVERIGVSLLPAPMPPGQANAEVASPLAFSARGAEALEPAPLADRRLDSIVTAILDRMSSLGLVVRPPMRDDGWHLTETETRDISWGPAPDFGTYDGAGYFLSATQSGLDLPPVAALRLDALSAWLIPETGVCAYMFGLASPLRIWTRVDGDRVTQLVQVSCQLGSASVPEGMVVMLVADGQGRGRAVVVAELTAGPYEGLPEGAPEPVLRAGLAADPSADWRIWPLTDQVVALSAPPDRIVLADLGTGRLVEIADPGAGLDALALLALTEDGAGMVQANRDGKVILRNFATGARIAEGAYLDDELVLGFADGTFRWTAEGARHARVKFAGDPAAYLLDQLAPPGPDGSFSLPPRLSLTAPPDAARPGQVTVTARAFEGLAAIEVYRDGLLVTQQDLTGDVADLVVDLPLLPETQVVSLVLRDRLGARSVPLGIDVPPAPGRPDGRLYVLAVGTDLYADPGLAPLAQAGVDARRFASALAAAPAERYHDVVTEVMVDVPDLATRLPARLAELASRAGSQDTLFLHLSGHGVLDGDGAFYLATSTTRTADLAGTALPWTGLQAALAAFPGRVIVFLDACHSGAADDSGAIFATNDDAVSGLAASDRIAVLSASKGRQLSYESATAGGGFFTASVVGAVGDPATDADGDETLSLEELYAAVKARTMALSDGRQTPWLSRNRLMGAVPLW